MGWDVKDAIVSIFCYATDIMIQYQKERKEVLNMSCLNENELYVMLKELYEKCGYRAVIADGFLKLYFSTLDTNTLCDLVIRIHSGVGTVESIRDDFVIMESNNDMCNQYKVIYLDGYEEGCEFYSELNISMDDSSLIDTLKNASIKGIKFIELFEHNKSVYKELHTLWKNNNKVAVVQATGTGKTVIIDSIVSSKIFKKVLLLAPSVSILNQAKNHIGEKIIQSLSFSSLTYSKLNSDSGIKNMCFDLIIY